jgi:hypothetical protein
MSATAVVVPADKAEQIESVFEGMAALGCQLAKSADGTTDGIVLKRVFKKDPLAAQRFCLEAGVLAPEGWLTLVHVQGRLIRFVRAYPKTAVPSRRTFCSFPEESARKSLRK